MEAFDLNNFTPSPTTSDEFALAVRHGLTTVPKEIPCKFLYDEKGSQLFDQITQQKEYYLTASELEILQEQSERIIQCLPATIATVVELGPGDGQKTEVFLRQFHRRNKFLTYIPVDISPSAVASTCNKLAASLPTLRQQGFVGDYFEYMAQSNGGQEGRLVLLLGSSIGNFSTDEAEKFLCRLNTYLRPQDYLLIGFDLKKDLQVMEHAYNDDAGITAEFNYNLLERINRELGGNFKKENFYHHEFYNAHVGAMQSYLVAKLAHDVQVTGLDLTVHFDQLEPLHVEDSYKYSQEEISRMAQACNFQLMRNFSDQRKFFVDSLWRKV